MNQCSWLILIRPYGTNFGQIRIEIQNLSSGQFVQGKMSYTNASYITTQFCFVFEYAFYRAFFTWTAAWNIAVNRRVWQSTNFDPAHGEAWRAVNGDESPHYVSCSATAMQVWITNLKHFAIAVTSQWARWRLKSPASRLFTPAFVQAQIKENFKAPRHWPLCGELTGHRWIPSTKSQ